jgi:hypothetical protein
MRFQELIETFQTNVLEEDEVAVVGEVGGEVGVESAEVPPGEGESCPEDVGKGIV